MSYDLYLKEPDGSTAIVPDGHDLRGGTYRLGGDDRAHLNVTYNYSPFYYRAFGEKGIRSLYGLTGRESLPILDAALALLPDDGIDVEDPAWDYWEATAGNARRALVNLRLLARACPDAVWDGD